jgi:hypothetical protein
MAVMASGYDYYQTEEWARAKAANDALQAATQAARDAEDAYAATPSAALQSALEASAQGVARALTSYTAATTYSPPAGETEAQRLIRNQTGVDVRGEGGPLLLTENIGFAPSGTWMPNTSQKQTVHNQPSAPLLAPPAEEPERGGGNWLIGAVAVGILAKIFLF